MSDPASSNRLRLSQLAIVLRPAFRCPTTPVAVRELYDAIVEELAAGDGAPLADGTGAGGSTGTGGSRLQGTDAVEAALRAVIMLRNAAGQPAGRPLTWRGDGIIDAADPDPEIGLHLALFGVEAMLAQLGWAPRSR